MKKLSASFILICIPLFIFGCSKTVTNEAEPQQLSAYINIEGNEVQFDEVEIVTTDDTERIQDLGLTIENDLPSGYHIYNQTVDVESYQLTDETKYIFTDFNQLFVDPKVENRLYETTNKEEFLEGSSYSDVPLEDQKIPYFLEVSNGRVISITEKFIYTQ
ncbi:MAG: hypothetical protein PHY44_09455 [Lachnospiraceae bacterium]|nr:hypothetical protein [Lachnospiraceae bacterium]